MVRNIAFSCVFAGASVLATGASATTLQLDGYTSAVQTVEIDASPVPDTPAYVGATGFRITDLGGGMGSFVAWCLDISHYLMSPGGSQNYTATDTPFSNSFGLSAVAKSRVQALFDANYATLDTTIGDQAAAFQIALWEAAYEDDGAALSLNDGLFQAMSAGSDAIAAMYLEKAALYAGASKYSLTFLEVDGDMDRGKYTGQNLVTATAVPLPAGGLLLISGLAGAALLRRRKA